VDDILFESTNQEFREEFGEIIGSKFEMSMIRELNFFVSLRINQTIEE
jgi:hypothetical protein